MPARWFTRQVVCPLGDSVEFALVADHVGDGAGELGEGNAIDGICVPPKKYSTWCLCTANGDTCSCNVVRDRQWG
jgi:hypothetical protein